MFPHCVCVCVCQQVSDGGQTENKMNLPVPIYLRPLDQKDASMKVRTLYILIQSLVY